MSEEANNEEQQQHPLSGDSTTTTGPLPPPPSIHTTNPAVPTLKSAPPSGNNNDDDDLPPPPVFTSTTTTNNNNNNATTSTSRGGDLPPPPVLSPMSASTTTTKTAAATTVGSTNESTATSSLPTPQSPDATITSAPSSTAATIPPAIEPPLPLPLTTFAPKSHSFLAKRQSRLPILVIATESVHRMAWKNKLRLNDLFEGLAQDLSSVSSGHPLAPFRSLSRSLLLDWDEDLKLSFFAVDDYEETTTTEDAQQLLQSHAALRDDDGNLAEELDLLEGQVDQLVLQAMDGSSNSSSSSSSNKSTTITVMEANRQRQFQYEQVVKDAFALTSPPNIPWLWRFRMALDESTTHLKATGDRMSQPLVCLLVCSTSDYVNANLDACIQDLAHPHNLPKRFYGGTSPPWDATKLKREVVVLHDAVEGPQQSVDLESLENQLKMNYGPNASLLTINSIVPSMAAALEQEETSDLWHGGGTRGNALSVSDRLNIRRYLAHLVASSLLPQMERRIAELNAFVTEKKKGVRNVFRGIFGGVVGSSSTSSSTNKTGGKTMDGTTGASTSSPSNATSTGSSKEAQFPTYRFDSIEAQARLLADSLFLMKDYEAAFSIYKLIKDDYKSERAMLQYASVQEHMALCLFHMMNDREASYYNANTTTKEMFGYLETALFHYTRVAEEYKSGSSSSSRPTTAPDATRLATRLCLVLSSAFITDNSNNISSSNNNNNNTSTTTEAAANAAATIERHLEVADLLASASSHETSLGAAVLLEQSSAHYYRAKMYRKYAFHMLMSGHMFRSAQQEHHAFRCFTSALYIYQDGQQWNELHNHLRSALAAQLYSLGRMAISVELYAKLVGTTGGGKVSVKSQQKFLNHLQEICQSHSKKALVGADRMATPLLQKRQERLQHIVSIIRSTKTTVRVLEIPNMDLPQIHDESLSVEVDISEPMSTSNHALMSKWKVGAPDVWEELECLTLAEVRASNQETTLETTTSNSRVAKNNTHTHRCLAALDQEKSNRRFAARSKKLSSYKGDRPIVRAQREPLQVSVTVKNPLSVTIELHHVQLVARLKKKQGASTQMCTNEHAIRKKTHPKDDNAAAEEEDSKKEWTFPGSSQTFVTPDFMLHSSTTGDNNNNDSATTWSSKDKSDNEEDPYFVVTCHKQILTSRNKTTLQMYICPLVAGELEILGLRAKLFDKVWMYHPFCLQGPLLQNTQHNRATRARAPSVRLQSLVQKRMPQLQATWEYSSAEERSNQTSFFTGEVTHWTLRLTNRGTAPLHDKVSLKTNLPWIHVLQQSTEEDDDVDPESMGTSTCIGPSGTLLSLALPDKVLEPGQRVDIPLAIRCDMIQQQQQPQKSRKQDLYFLFRYGYDDEFRWLRQMCTISMAPSLSLSASVMPSYWQRAEHVLSVEITNQNPQTSLQLEKMALVSRDYRLEPIAGQQQQDDDNDETNEAQSSLLLQAYERSTMHYRLIPTTLSKKKKCMLTECLFSLDHSASVRRQECTSSGSTMDFICLERAHSNFTQALIEHQQQLMGSEEDQQPRHVSQIRRDAAAVNDDDTSTSQEDEDNKDHPTSISQLFPHHNNNNSIDLICTWNKPGSETNANTATSSGQHVLPHISVRPPNTGCPLTLTSRHPSRVVHDFSSSPIVMVPLEITIRNRLHPSDTSSNNNNALEFEFSLEHDPSGIISFQGSEQYASNSLGGGDDITLSLQAYIQQPGVVNLQMVRLTILEKQQEQKSMIKRTPYLFPLQWMVQVVDEPVTEDLN